MTSAKYWIDKLGLIKHPEGGHFKEIYRSDEQIDKEALPDRFSGSRSFSTSIYFLLEKGEFSAFHRIKSDEIWHFYSGGAAVIHIISEEGNYTKSILGSDIEDGESFQVIVKQGSWFAAHVDDNVPYTLVGCTVAPGFDFNDFELANKEQLTAKDPQHEKLISDLTIK